ncbi:MAG: class I mannose-6-phosphate isomerase [Candidatus Hydrogenedentes bacterium]|nr:class I mannose-6-phosphate isomerase [Candidatus Hydrogenedentota bacterium]
MAQDIIGILAFEEAYMPRIWGGRRLNALYGKELPGDTPVGEAWLISDHAQHVSVVSDGPLAGRGLDELLAESPDALLGTHARPTIHGRFPLLLKLLDASEWLSVQVHPNDAQAADLGEADSGKTEMWHILDAQPGSELICGLNAEVSSEQFRDAVEGGTIDDVLRRVSVEAGCSVYVRAGTVHTIGAGIVLAEIQQNSDITYRIHDWDRRQPDGTPRELHLDKAIKVLDPSSRPRVMREGLALDSDSAYQRGVLAACRHFAAERIEIDGAYRRNTRGTSFHLLLGTTGSLHLNGGETDRTLRPGEALLVGADLPTFTVSGAGVFLDYYVPDIGIDLLGPLTAAGHSSTDIAMVVTES